MNVAAAVTAAIVAAAPPRGIFPYSARLPMLGLPFLVGTSLMAYLGYLVVAYLPAAFRAYDQPSGRSVGGGRRRLFALGPREDR
jgi:hypothetical protein